MSESPRLKAYGLIDDMPDKGMPEVIEFLAEALEFYRWRPDPKPPLEPVILRGILLPVTTRPDIEIDLEEAP